MAVKNPIPEVAAALVCQASIVDATTSMRTLANIFSKMLVPAFPALASLGLYVKMIDGFGTYQMRIRFVRLRDDFVILDFPQEIAWNIELTPIEVGVSFQAVPIEEEGPYEFQIFMDDIYVGRSPFTVNKVISPTSLSEEPR